MTKTDFILALSSLISGLPAEEVDERLDFYSEMIDDLMEEGFTEEEAVAKMGNVRDIAEQIISDTPFSKIVKEKMKQKRKLLGWETALLILGFPLWFPLLVAAFAVLLSLYISIWAIVISIWAVEVSLWGAAIGCIGAGIINFIMSSPLSGAALIATAFISAGVALLAMFGCKAATKGLLLLSKKLFLSIKKSFVHKEAEK